MNRANLLLLAAGKSSRMGQSKADLVLNGKNLVQWHLESFAGIGAVYIVTGKHNYKEFKGLNTLINPFAPDCSPFESLQFGLANLEEMALPTFVLPVDFMPMPKEIWAPMLAEERRGKMAVLPSFSGKKGHPVLLSCALQRRIKETKDGRLDHLLHGLKSEECSILELEFPQIHQQFNTKEEFEKLAATTIKG